MSPCGNKGGAKNVDVWSKSSLHMANIEISGLPSSLASDFWPTGSQLATTNEVVSKWWKPQVTPFLNTRNLIEWMKCVISLTMGFGGHPHFGHASYVGRFRKSLKVLIGCADSCQRRCSSQSCHSAQVLPARFYHGGFHPGNPVKSGGFSSNPAGLDLAMVSQLRQRHGKWWKRLEQAGTFMTLSLERLKLFFLNWFLLYLPNAPFCKQSAVVQYLLSRYFNGWLTLYAPIYIYVNICI